MFMIIIFLTFQVWSTTSYMHERDDTVTTQSVHAVVSLKVEKQCSAASIL